MQSINAGDPVKNLRDIQRSAGSRWVGDGFPVAAGRL